MSCRKRLAPATDEAGRLSDTVGLGEGTTDHSNAISLLGPFMLLASRSC